MASSESPVDEDSFFQNLAGVSYSEEIEQVLTPHVNELTLLSFCNDNKRFERMLEEGTISESDVDTIRECVLVIRDVERAPARENGKMSWPYHRLSLVKNRGDTKMDPRLLVRRKFREEDFQGVYAFMFQKFPKELQTREGLTTWCATEVTTHAFTILMQHQMQKSGDRVSIDSAYKNLMECLPHPECSLNLFDIDRECQLYLEEFMFSVTSEAGVSGYPIWGLDAGAHQDFWYPYWEVPQEWIEKKRLKQKTAIKV